MSSAGQLRVLGLREPQTRLEAGAGVGCFLLYSASGGPSRRNAGTWVGGVLGRAVGCVQGVVPWHWSPCHALGA